MRALNTAEGVIQATGVRDFPDYFDVIPYREGAGFTVKRYYLPNTKPTRVVTAGGQPAVCVLLHFSVEEARAAAGVRAVGVYVRLLCPYGQGRIEPFNFGDPGCPTPESFALLRGMQAPLQLEFNDEFVYDVGEERFYGQDGPVTPRQILDYAFEFHCRTLRWAFRIRWAVRSAVQRALRRTVWSLHGVFLGILEKGYGIKLRVPPHRWPTLFPKYTFADFERTGTSETSHFFGFQSSKGALLANLVVMAGGFFIAYWSLPRSGIIRVELNRWRGRYNHPSSI